MALITFATVFKDEKENLPHLLSSIVKEIPRHLINEFHFLFLDNDSQDSSPKIIHDWLEKHSSLSGEVLSLDQNNMAVARQKALQKANTLWLVFVDADTQLQNQWGQKLIQIIKNLEPQVVAVGGETPYVKTQDWHKYIDPLAQIFPLQKKGEQPVVVDHLPTNNLLIHVENGRRAGGFDPFFARVGEDLDFSVRLRQLGQILFDPRISIDHKFPKTPGAWFRKMAFYGRAQSYVFLKYGGEIPLIKFIPFFLVLLIPVASYLYPLVVLILTLVALVSQRVFLVGLSVLFYGMGEWVGGFHYLLKNLKEIFFGEIPSPGKFESDSQN